MKNEKTAADRYFTFLTGLSKRERGFKTFGKILTKNKLTPTLSQILKREKLVEKNADGVWQWIGGTPTLDMASDLVVAVNDNVKKYLKPGKKSGKGATVSVPKLKRAYAKRAKQARSSDVLDLSALRQERIDILNRVGKIDAVLEVASGL